MVRQSNEERQATVELDGTQAPILRLFGLLACVLLPARYELSTQCAR